MNATTHDEIRKAAIQANHAVEALVAAVVLEPLPSLVRQHLAEALASTARVAGLVEGLAEGQVQVPPSAAAHRPAAMRWVLDWPATIFHRGKVWCFTGKTGTNNETGWPAAEYEAEDAGRVWRIASGDVVPE